MQYFVILLFLLVGILLYQIIALIWDEITFAKNCKKYNLYPPKNPGGKWVKK